MTKKAALMYLATRQTATEQPWITVLNETSIIPYSNSGTQPTSQATNRSETFTAKTYAYDTSIDAGTYNVKFTYPDGSSESFENVALSSGYSRVHSITEGSGTTLRTTNFNMSTLGLQVSGYRWARSGYKEDPNTAEFVSVTYYTYKYIGGLKIEV